MLRERFVGVGRSLLWARESVMRGPAPKRVFEPIEIRGKRFRNRIVKTPQDMNFADFQDGSITQDSVDFYGSLAAGGVGGIIVEQSIVDREGWREGTIGVYDDGCVPGLTRLADAVHEHGCPIILQINHLGPNAFFPPNGKHPGYEARVPSLLSEDEMRRLFLGFPWKLKPLTIPEIQAIVVRYADAAERAKNAGFDGIELHGDHYYLINSFLSRVYNHRDDEYGCNTLEDRARFVVEVMQSCRERVGDDFICGMKLKGAEYGDPLGTTVAEAQEFARMIEKAGADYFNVTADGYNEYWRVATAEQLLFPEPPSPLREEFRNTAQPGTWVAPLGAAIKQAVSVPVGVVGRLDAELGEKILEAGQADFLIMGRRLLADQQYPLKMARGRKAEVRPCTACMTCETRMVEYEGLACQVNAAIGRGCENEFAPASQAKSVAVVGGGPAGMEAARVMAMRGHDVTLYEKEAHLGGLLNLAALVKGTDIFNLRDLVDYFRGELERLGVTLRLGEEFTPAIAEATKPDAILVAAGGLPGVVEVPGIDGSNVISAAELRERARLALRVLGPKSLGRVTKTWLPVGKRVVIVGGGIQGCETAEFLVKRGRAVTIVEASDRVGMEIPMLQRILLLPWLERKGTEILTEVRYDSISDTGITVTGRDGHPRTLEADTIIVALPLRPNPRPAEVLKNMAPEIRVVGDCSQPGLIIDAIADGFAAGRAL
jgi:2,4-dienoyl-CoA reductase-like NADH-dependent reductase (Old Yellow Enzyme family)/thioredoxin reductase